MKVVRATYTVARRATLLVLITLTPPTTAALYFLVNGINQDIAVATKEQHGNTYQSALQELLEKLPLHEVATAETDRAALAQAIDSAFTRLDRVDSLYGTELEVTPEGLAKR